MRFHLIAVGLLLFPIKECTGFLWVLHHPSLKERLLLAIVAIILLVPSGKGSGPIMMSSLVQRPVFKKRFVAQG